MTAPDTRLGQRVRELRGRRSQQKIADAMRARGWKWSQMTVWGLERGDRSLKLLEAVDLARVLRVDVADLLGEQPDHEKVRMDLHTTPEAEDRAAGRADNPALATETVAKAEQRALQGWPWPVSGDATAILQPGKIPWGVKRRGRLK